MTTQDHTAEHAEGQHHEGMTKRKIWQVFFYLLALTALEFFIALVLVHGGAVEKGLGVTTVYIALTVVKDYYIIAYFMQLKFETFGYIMSVAIVLERKCDVQGVCGAGGLKGGSSRTFKKK